MGSCMAAPPGAELNLTRQCSRALGEEFAEAEAAAAQLEAQRRRAEDREHKVFTVPT